MSSLFNTSGPYTMGKRDGYGRHMLDVGLYGPAEEAEYRAGYADGLAAREADERAFREQESNA